MNVFKTGPVSLHWRQDGDLDGPAVVFANSLGTDLRLWDAVVAQLPQSLRIVRFDKRGHGLSSCPPAPYTMDELVDDAEALIDHIGLRDIAFVGLSIGGMIGQALAARRPELISGLVMSNSAAVMGDPKMWQARISAVQAGGLEAIADPVMERWFSPAFRATDELALWRTMMTRTAPQGYTGCCSSIAGADLTASTSKLTLPVLGIAGELDGASPPEVVRGTVERISGARLETLPGVGHLPCVEAPQTYGKILLSFLKEIGHV